MDCLFRLPKTDITLERRRDLLSEIFYFTLKETDFAGTIIIPDILQLIFEEKFSVKKNFIGIEFLAAQLCRYGPSFDRCLKLAKDLIWLLQFYYVMKLGMSRSPIPFPNVLHLMVP